MDKQVHQLDQHLVVCYEAPVKAISDLASEYKVSMIYYSRQTEMFYQSLSNNIVAIIAGLEPPMRTHLRKIGNSRGVIIPAALLETSELEEEVNLRVEGKTLVIEALNAPRKDWLKGYKADEDADEWPAFPVDDENAEWEW